MSFIRKFKQNRISRRTFTVGKEVVLSTVSDAPRIVLGETSAGKLILLSNDTVHRRTDDMVSDIKEQSLQPVRSSLVFVIKLVKVKVLFRMRS